MNIPSRSFTQHGGQVSTKWSYGIHIFLGLLNLRKFGRVVFSLESNTHMEIGRWRWESLLDYEDFPDQCILLPQR